MYHPTPDEVDASLEAMGVADAGGAPLGEALGE
jgi:hypothetical protein